MKNKNTKQFFVQKYIKNKKSIPTIAKIVNSSCSTILRRLIKYNISRRTRSEAQKLINRKGKLNSNFKHGNYCNKYYCIECNKRINHQSACFGQGRCQSCSKKDTLNSNFGNKWTKKQKIKQSILIKLIMNDLEIKQKMTIKRPTMLGKNNHRYGKFSYNCKRTKYKGSYMRSTWEAAFAKYCIINHIKYRYESKRFYFEDCTYLPDFYLPEQNLWIEIKGWWRKEDKKRFNLFKKIYPNKNIKVLMKKELQKLGVL